MRILLSRIASAKPRTPSTESPFRPRAEPARRIYDAFQAEAALRKERPVEVWIQKELEVVWRVARDYAQQQGVPVLSLEDIERAECSARGHIDYGSKWAYRVAEQRQAAQQPRPGVAR